MRDVHGRVEVAHLLEANGSLGRGRDGQQEQNDAYSRSWASRHSRGSLSSRQRTSFVPWRMRLPVTWS